MTLAELSKKIGVSTATISRVLNDDAVSQQLQKRRFFMTSRRMDTRSARGVNLLSSRTPTRRSPYRKTDKSYRGRFFERHS